jgi:hypothetical protein
MVDEKTEIPLLCLHPCYHVVLFPNDCSDEITRPVNPNPIWAMRRVAPGWARSSWRVGRARPMQAWAARAGSTGRTRARAGGWGVHERAEAERGGTLAARAGCLSHSARGARPAFGRAGGISSFLRLLLNNTYQCLLHSFLQNINIGSTIAEMLL